jgi:hypothetical protein
VDRACPQNPGVLTLYTLFDPPTKGSAVSTDEHVPDPDADLTPEEAIRESAWQEALRLHREWEQAVDDVRRTKIPTSTAHANLSRVRTLLDVVVTEHGFEDTRVDPIGLSYFEQREAPWTRPPLDRPACTGTTETCPRHYSARRVGLPAQPCGRRDS